MGTGGTHAAGGGRDRPGARLPRLLEACDGRRRARLALASALRWAVPALAASVALAAAWRLTGSRPLAAGALLAPVLCAAGGAARGLGRRDLLAAAGELDSRAGLEAALSTGYEVSTGRIGGPLAGAALAEAERSAAALSPASVPVSAPPWARFLAVPAAVLAGLFAIPAQVARTGRGDFLLDGAGPGGGGAAGTRDAERDRGARREGDSRVRVAVPADRAEVRRPETAPDAEAAKIDLPVPPRPARAKRNLSKVAARGADSKAGAEAGDSGGGAGAGATPGAGGRDAGAAPHGPVDAGEAALVRERFPEYREVVRRYFSGARD